MQINVIPKTMQNGDSVLFYTDTTDTLGQVYTFPSSQERVRVKNLGTAPITYSVGSQTGSVGPSETIDVIETISQFTLTSTFKTQAFEVWSDELGSNQSNVDLSVLSSQMADNVQQLSKISNTKDLTSIIDFDITKTSVGLATILNIPTYVETNDEAVHPCVYYNPNGWNGYKYWMAFTPYTASNNQYENPSIVVSNDGFNWVIPTGLVNPLELAPSGGYNSDTHLTMSPDEKMLYIIYRDYSNGREKIVSKSTTDGINWGAKIILLDTSDTVERNVSPAVVWDGKQYVMWTVDILPSPKVLRKRTSPSLEQPFSNSVACTFPVPTAISTNDDLWHLDVKKIGDKFYCLMDTSLKSSGGSGGSLYLGKSSDGVIWQTQSETLIDAIDGDKMYRSCFLPKITGEGNKFAVWYSSISPWNIGYFEISFGDFNAKFETDKQIKILSSINKIQPYIIGDTFNRIDSTSGLGVANSGQTWVANTGTFGISGNYASPTANANARSVIDAGTSDVHISVDVATIGTQAWMVGRLSDASNYIRCGMTGTAPAQLGLQKIVGGSVTNLFLSSYMCKDGDHIEMDMKGDKIKIYRNGMLVSEVTETFNQTSSQVGLQASSTTTKFDNFSVKKV
jgi:hypothetical protein